MMPVLLLVSALVTDPGKLTEEFHRDFGRGDFDFLLTGPNARQAVALDRGGVRIELPSGHETSPPVGFATRMPVHGDFEITVSYRDLEVETPDVGNGSGLSLYVTLNSPRQEAASVAHLLTPRGQWVYLAHRAETPPGKARRHEVETAPARPTAGKLRLARVGSALRYAQAEDGGEFRQIHQVPVGPEDLDMVRVAVEPGRARSGASVVVTDLTVRSEALPGSPRASPLTRGRLWAAVGVFAGLLAVGGLAGWWYRTRGGRTPPPTGG